MRQPKPFFRKQTQSWYVQLNGKQINLGKNEAEALKKYHFLMAEKQEASPAMPVIVLIDQFLSNLKQTAKAQRTYDWYKLHLDSFRKWLQDRFNGRLTVAKLTPRPCRRLAVGAIQKSGRQLQKLCHSDRLSRLQLGTQAKANCRFANRGHRTAGISAPRKCLP
ncbi:MAG TPA: hypothetical protein VGG30_06535 [Pirellulales bacterium]